MRVVIYSLNRLKMLMSRRALLAAALFLCWMPFAVFGQTASGQASELRVVVVDPTEALIAGSNVELWREGDPIGSVRTEGTEGASFSRIVPGRYELRVQAEGFAAHSVQITLRPGANVIRVKLEVRQLTEEVDVERDDEERRTDPRSGAFSNVLTPEQIADLPDDPDALETALRRLAGPGATIRVDGFTGGRLPPKSSIASIRIIRSLYDAEFHEHSLALIDVTTRAGSGRWSGLLGFRFNDEALNARNAFSSERRPRQLRNFDFYIDGPLRRDRASIFLLGYATDSFDTRTIFAATPSGALQDQARAPARSFYGLAKLSYNISRAHFLNVGYETSIGRTNNTAISNFDLPERGFGLNSSLNQLRISETGTFGGRLFNELRSQIIWQTEETTPESATPAVIVLNAFSSGGAQNQNRTRTHSFSVEDILTFSFAAHALKVGGLIERETLSRDYAANTGGTFVFESLEDFRLGRPSTYSLRASPARVSVSQNRFGFFAQDDIRIRRNFTLSLGLRYERQSGLSDGNNFAPRIGFAWSPRREWRTTLRGGGGVFYTWIRPDTLSVIVAGGEEGSFETIVINPGFPNPFVGGMIEALPPSLRRQAPNLQNPFLVQSSLGVEQQLGGAFVLRGNFVYQRGFHLLRSRDLNAPLPGSGERPNAQFGNLLQVESSAFFRRNAFNLEISGVPLRNSYIFLNYTLAKATDDADGVFSLPVNSYDLRAEGAESSSDIRHNLFAGAGSRVWKRLRISTQYSLRSPTPYTITTGRDMNGDSFFNDRPEGVARNSERGRWQGEMQARLSWTWIFRKVDNDGGVPGTIVLDQSEAAGGQIELGQSWSANFYLQANNLLNQTNYTNFSGVQTSPFFGRPTAAAPPRRIELGVRFRF